MQEFLSFLGHGGFKLLIVAFFLIAHLMKKNGEKTAREAQPPREMPNSMPQAPTLSQDSMPPLKPNASPQPKTLQSGSSSPWSNSSNPFDGTKK